MASYASRRYNSYGRNDCDQCGKECDHTTSERCHGCFISLCAECSTSEQCMICAKEEGRNVFCEQCTVRCENCCGLILCKDCKFCHLKECNPPLFYSKIIRVELMRSEGELKYVRHSITRLEVEVEETKESVQFAYNEEERLDCIRNLRELKLELLEAKDEETSWEDYKLRLLKERNDVLRGGKVGEEALRKREENESKNPSIK